MEYCPDEEFLTAMPPIDISYFEVIRRLLQYIKKHQKRIVASYIFALIQIPLELAQPYFLNALIAQAIHSSGAYDPQQQFHTLALLILLKTIASAIDELKHQFTSKIDKVIDNEITADLFQMLIKRDIIDFDRYGTSRLTHILTKTGELANFILDEFPKMIKSVLLFPSSFIVMYRINPTLSVVCLVGVPILAYIQKYQADQREERWRQYDKLPVLDTDGHMWEVMNTVRNVRSFGCERHEAQTLRDLLKQRLDRDFSYTWDERLANLMFSIVSRIMEYTILLYGGYLIKNGLLTPENYLIFESYQNTLNSSINEMSWNFKLSYELLYGAKRAFGFMDIAGGMKRDGEQRPVVKGDIQLKDLSFAYDTRPETKVLENFNLHIKAGESVALVGPSGGGKSTIFSLIERFYDPASGQLILDGVPVEEIDEEYYHKQIALVAQEPVLYNRTIRDNIIYGCDGATEEDMLEAAKMANVDVFVSQLKDGYDTLCGDVGSQFSGGQRQRIAIARAIVRKPSILLLDEATSALDTESEYVVQEALDSCCQERTVIVIAHRLSTIRNVDKIAVVKAGRVSEFGTHEDLMKIKDGTYRSLVHLQMKGFRGESIEAAFEDLTNANTDVLCQ